MIQNPLNLGIYLTLTNDRFTLVDADDYEWISQWRWRFCGRYAVRSISKNGREVRFYLHRVINSTPIGFETDHINGDRLDNRRRNLRTCTTSQNQANQRKAKNNSSGYKGVHWRSHRKKWQATVYKDGKEYYAGRYANVEDAAKAYNALALKLHGEFAQLNQIPEYPTGRAMTGIN